MADLVPSCITCVSCEDCSPDEEDYCVNSDHIYYCEDVEDLIMDLKQIRVLRDAIDGELNRIAVTDDTDEIVRMCGFLTLSIAKYAKGNMDRVNGVLEHEYPYGYVKKEE